MTEKCIHTWNPDNVKDGEPVFKIDRRIGGKMPILEVTCEDCGCAFWMNKPAWDAHQARLQKDVHKQALVARAQ